MPASIAVANQENFLYIADKVTHVIRVVTLSAGTITTFAGVPGLAAYAGDGTWNLTTNASVSHLLRRSFPLSKAGERRSPYMTLHGGLITRFEQVVEQSLQR